MQRKPPHAARTDRASFRLLYGARRRRTQGPGAVLVSAIAHWHSSEESACRRLRPAALGRSECLPPPATRHLQVAEGGSLPLFSCFGWKLWVAINRLCKPVAFKLYCGRCAAVRVAHDTQAAALTCSHPRSRLPAVLHSERPRATGREAKQPMPRGDLVVFPCHGVPRRRPRLSPTPKIKKYLRDGFNAGASKYALGFI